MFVWRELGKGSFELFSGQIQGVVIDILPGFFDSLKKKVDLSQVAAELA